MQITFDLSKLGYWDIKSIQKVLGALYQEVPTIDREIIDAGFNTRTGYAYLVLENQIQVVSSMGNPAEYLVTDPDTDEEIFCESYDEAQNMITKLNPYGHE